MAACVDTLVDRILKEFNSSTSKPENFLSVQDACNQAFRAITKELFDFGNQYHPTKGFSGALPELYTDGFDEEQIWQQLELQNEPSFHCLMKRVAKLLSSAKGKKLSFHKVVVQNTSGSQEETEDEAEEQQDDASSVLSDLSYKMSDDGESHEEGSDLDDFDELKFDEYNVLEDDKDASKQDKKKKQPIYKKTEVDDQFFKLREMEDFLQREETEKPEKTDDDDDDDSIDFFEDIPLDEEGEDEGVRAKYKDFFKGSIPAGSRKRFKKDDEEDAEDEAVEDEMLEEEEGEDDHEEDEPGKKRVKFNFDDESSEDESESSDDEQSPELKSSFEQRQERLKAKIKDLEDEAVGPKPWQLLGESKAELRPENALLEEDLFFDHTARQAPVITEETTRTLEDIIRQRIKDQAFDDVERKVKPVYDPIEFKKKLVLDQEKSKYSLAEIYEQEYLKKQELQHSAAKASSLADPIGDKPVETKEHVRIRKLMNDLFHKLDALCNFHYTPKMPAPEIKIVSNMPSIAMEEIAPVTVSDANLLAPEEVQEHVRGELMGSTEKEKTDRLRERRQKKAAQRLRHKEKERAEKAVDKANPGLGNKHARTRVLNQLQKAEKEGTVSLIKDNKSKATKSSTAFFAQLQDDVTASVDAVKRSKQKSTVKKKAATGSQLKL